MSKRTTIQLDDDVYEKLVTESLRKYGTAKAMSKVANELLKRALRGQAKVLESISLQKLRGSVEFDDKEKMLRELVASRAKRRI